jgi:hypothetical protein
MQETSETDGKSYIVQYFERAVFESHPENQPPNDVLLSLLGVFMYKQRYQSGTPAQSPNTQAGSVLFPETGKRVGGKFLDYWNKNGALAQQGYPISDEFSEVSTLNGQTYTVQYFERAVFEAHPENQPPYDVLLSQLGTFRYQAKYLAPPTPTLIPTSVASPAPANTPVPEPTTAAGPDCSGIPPSDKMTATPNCGPAGSTFQFEGTGFLPGENVGIYTTTSSGQVFGTSDTGDADKSGKVTGWYINTYTDSPTGIWATTMEGLTSHNKAISYFKVTAPLPPDCSDIPTGESMVVTPNCAPGGTRFQLDAFGFRPGEVVTRVYTTPSGQSFQGSSNVVGVGPDGKLGSVTFVSFRDDERGIWTATFEGRSSGHVARGYFKIYAP